LGRTSLLALWAPTLPTHQVVWVAICVYACYGLRPQPQPLGARSVRATDLEPSSRGQQLVEDEGLALARATADRNDSDWRRDAAQDLERRRMHLKRGMPWAAWAGAVREQWRPGAAAASR
jgi:hypothetical protein